MYRKNLVFAAACMGMLLFGIVFLSLGSVRNMLIDRFHLSASDYATLAALLPLGILVGSLIFGPVVDRFGYRWMLVAASLSVGMALEGLAFTDSERLLQLLFFVIGVGGGILNGATNALAADVSEGERGAKLNLLGAFYCIGALTPPTTFAILSRSYSISSIVAGIGVLVLMPVPYCLGIVFPPPKQRTEKFSAGRLFTLLRDPIFFFAGLALAIQSGMEGMSNDWITGYFKDVTLAGVSREWETQLGLIAIIGAMAVTRFALAALLKRVNSQVVLLVSIGITATGAIILMNAPGYGTSLLAAMLIGAGLAAAFPVILGYIGDRYPQQLGTAFSTIFVIALVGNMAINKTFGYVAEIHGIEQYAKVMLILLAASAVLVYMVCSLFVSRPAQ
jgi:FHS family glucose/mannose:H+ symporter-like MFS transporter